MPSANSANRRTREVLELLRHYESRNVTFIDETGGWPIVWDRAKGTRVWDADGKRYLDLTAAFGVAATGHANPDVVRAGQKQLARLTHAMGDVHPHALKAHLARELSRITFERWRQGPGKTIFGNSGFEAVEAALKTAMLATGKRGVIAFEAGYHGLGYGALNATHRKHFRKHFQKQLGGFVHFVPFPEAKLKKQSADARTDPMEIASRIRDLLENEEIGAILIEPVQVRGGIRIPPWNFLQTLRQICDESGALLILDEIYTGFGRTGRWFACEHANVAPDLICLGKALTNGFPLSACVGRANLMDAAWPPSNSEAIHTSTFLGHPVGCAMALAQIRELKSKNLIQQTRRRGIELGRMLSKLDSESRVIGLLAGVELRTAHGQPATEQALRAVKALLSRGFIFLPEGEFANVISFSPPLTITTAELKKAVDTLSEVLAQTATHSS
jgi:4-aminobutyrate aminotransferase-like enzyme